MDRISGQGYVLVGGLREWADRNLQTGVQGTFGNALWFNGVQEELMAIIAAGGETPNATNWTQVLTAIETIIGQKVTAILNADAWYSVGVFSFYFCVTLQTGGFIIVQGSQCVLPAGVKSISQLLPVAFNSQFGGALVSDGNGVGSGTDGAVYGYGASVGADLAHINIQCPLYQLEDGAIYARGQAQGFFIAWGK